MIAIDVHFLTGRVIATDRTDRFRSEWPLHPDRLFSTLVAALHAPPWDLGSADHAAERAALEWLEGLEAPDLIASEASARAVATVYVPVNDVRLPAAQEVDKAGGGKIREHLQVLPSSRLRQPRTFPSVTPEVPVQTFVWRNAELGAVRHHTAALEQLCNRV